MVRVRVRVGGWVKDSAMVRIRIVDGVRRYGEFEVSRVGLL